MDSIESYLTISSSAEALLKEKSSKFFAYAFPVNSIEEIQSRIVEVKNDHHSARHWCYAYRLNPDGKEFRANDDGEPSHSAGDPILRQIDSRNLTNTLVIVVRYFGGIKLGVGGLIQAYGGAAAQALDQCRIIEKEIREELRIEFDYTDMNDVMRIMKKFGADMHEHEFLESCWIVSRIRRKEFKEFHKQLSLLHKVNLIPKNE
ncbi:MAG: YigZ family protein [Flavobacteriales bacterium]|nr:YigZ family protein [Flavobacteriales bacterium]